MNQLFVNCITLSLIVTTVYCRLPEKYFDRGRTEWDSSSEEFRNRDGQGRDDGDFMATSYQEPVVVVDKGPTNLFEEDSDVTRLPFTPFWGLRRHSPWRSWIFAGKRNEPWWKGSNVCVERKVIDEAEKSGSGTEKVDNETSSSTNEESRSFFGGSFFISTHTSHCYESESAYVCTTTVRNGKVNKTTVVKYECCHGFKRKTDGSSGCTEANMKDLKQTLEDVGSSKFAEALAATDLKESASTHNVTVFSLTNDAMNDVEEHFGKKDNEISIMNEPGNSTPDKTGQLKNVLSRHMFTGWHRANSFTNNEILTSIDNSTRIRINVYNAPRRVVTANCAPVVSPDNHANNGIIHVVDRPIPVSNQSLAQLLEKDDRFTIFKEWLKDSGLLETLADDQKAFTVFAPTDTAIKKMDQAYINRLKNENSCFEGILRSHIINSVLCSAGIFGQISLKSSSSASLVVSRNYEQKLFVDESEIVARDLVGSNGVIQAINGIITPRNFQPLSKVLANSVTDEYLKLLNSTDLLNEWDAKQNLSLFVPTNEAFKKLKGDQLERFQNNTKEILAFHMIPSRTSTQMFHNNELLETGSGKKMRINLFGEFPEQYTRATSQCANIIMEDKDVCNGVVHLVDRVLFPPEKNLFEAIQSLDGFEIFKKLVNASDFDSKLKSDSGPYTVLLPPDEAFQAQFDEKKMDEWIKDPKKATKLVQKHILPEFFCCSGVNQMPFLFSFSQYRTLDGSTVSVHRDFDGKIKIGLSAIKKCDLISENGVIQIVDKVLEPSRSSSNHASSSRVPLFPRNPFLNIFIN